MHFFAVRLVFLGVSALVLVNGDLHAAVWRSNRNKNDVVPAAAPPHPTPVVVRLQKVAALPTQSEASVVGEHGIFYVGNISVGVPAQELRMLFDTSSGHVLLPHRACNSAACLRHRRYSPWSSRTSEDVNVNGNPVVNGSRLASLAVSRDFADITMAQADLGEGDAEGVVVKDQMCLGESNEACAIVEVVAATHLDDRPFLSMPHDGIVGLGLESSALDPKCSFFGRLLSQSKGMLPHFGMTFGADGGEVHFGSHDRARLAEHIQWFPVTRAEIGYWQVAILSVRVGNHTVDDCSEGCNTIIDTGASRLGVQASRFHRLRVALETSTELAPTGSASGLCKGPELTFDLGGMTLALQPEDYVFDHNCAPRMGSLNLDFDRETFRGVYVLGEPLLRRHYVAFDWEAKKVGFARTALEDATRQVDQMFV